MNKTRLILPILLLMMILPITTVKAQDPSVQIYDNITEGQTLSGTKSLTVSAYHPDGIRVISISTIEIGFVCHILYESLLDYDWDTTEYGDGQYTLRISAASEPVGGNQALNWIDYTIHIDNIPDTTTETTTTESETTTTETGLPFEPTPDDTNPTYPYAQQALMTYATIAVIITIIIIIALKRRRSKPSSVLPPLPSNAKVLIICPYCGAKTEQGLTSCKKCNAEL